MPDITLGYVPTTGGAFTASGFNGDIYTPTARTSFETINGWLDRDNRESAWKVSYDKVRPRSCAWAESVGATNNLDYFPLFFPADENVTGAYLAIPGASKAVTVPRSGGCVKVVAHLVESNSLTDSQTNGAKLRLFRIPAGSSTAARVTGSMQVVATAVFTSTKRLYRDRQYTFHYLDTSASTGRYHYYLGLWVNGALLMWDSVASQFVVVSVRVRARAISAEWIG